MRHNRPSVKLLAHLYLLDNGVIPVLVLAAELLVLALGLPLDVLNLVAAGILLVTHKLLALSLRRALCPATALRPDVE